MDDVSVATGRQTVRFTVQTGRAWGISQRPARGRGALADLNGELCLLGAWQQEGAIYLDVKYKRVVHVDIEDGACANSIRTRIQFSVPSPGVGAMPGIDQRLSKMDSGACVNTRWGPWMFQPPVHLHTVWSGVWPPPSTPCECSSLLTVAPSMSVKTAVPRHQQTAFP